MTAPRHSLQAPILPGRTLGILGTGQLGRMLAIAARRMGYHVHCYSPERHSPTGQIADVEIAAPYEDLDSVRHFGRSVDVVTFEFENVPSRTTEALEEVAVVRPSSRVLHVTQHRAREKRFLADHGMPVPPFLVVSTLDQALDAVDQIGAPCVIKTAAFGYDGKGQARVDHRAGMFDAWRALATDLAVVEAFVDFRLELSVVVARAVDGTIAAYDVIENAHVHHILDVSVVPARVPHGVAEEAVRLATHIAKTLDIIGVLCVELFLTRDDRLLVNELAPRPHNSGHFSFDAAVTSQFEQQLRAVCGLPLGSTRLLSPAAMVNLLGDLWDPGEPSWHRALAEPDVKLHLYGKAAAAPGRKMGHLTALGATVEEAEDMARRARRALTVDR
jgi:5-(carboxyamino)imidazole ribonucleotide synthase